MATKKKVGIGIAGLLTIVAGIAGGSYAFDFSSESNVDNSVDNSVTSGDTTITNTVTGEVIEKGALFVICLMDPIPEGYITACQNR